MVKNILTAMFAGPAAFAVLAKLDDRLNFNPIIERIVLNFDHFYRGVWTSISSFVNLDLSQFSNLLSLIVLLFCTVAMNLMRGARKSYISARVRGAEEKRNEYLARTFTALVAFLFLMFTCVIFSVPQLIPAMTLLEGTLNLSKDSLRDYKQTRNKKQRVFACLNLTALVMAYLTILPFATYATISINSPEIESDIQWWVIALFCYPLSILFYLAIKYCKQSLANIAYWVIGVFLVNWVSVIALPVTSEYLDRIGV